MLPYRDNPGRDVEGRDGKGWNGVWGSLGSLDCKDEGSLLNFRQVL